MFADADCALGTRLTSRNVDAARHAETVLAVAARLRINLRADAIADVERFDYDGDGAAFLVTAKDGGRFAFFDAWRPFKGSRIRVSGYLGRTMDGRYVGIAARNRLDYGTTPQDSDDWANMPDRHFAAAQDMARRIMEVAA
jgi:hypothetical protein